MYDLTEFRLRNAVAATSALLLPWVMRARISDSRSVRPSDRPGQSSPVVGRDRPGAGLIDGVAGVNGFERGDQVACGQRLGQVAVGPLAHRTVDQVGMEVPGVDDDPAGVRILDEHPDLVVVGLRLGERVVQHDVDVVLERCVEVDLDDDDPVRVPVEHVRQTDEHDLVVVDERNRDRRRATRSTTRSTARW